MENQQIVDVADFFWSKGGMHDARIESVIFSVVEKTLELKIDDVNSNFLGLPDYAGQQPAAITFLDVRDCKVALEVVDQHLSVDEITVDKVALSSGTGLRVKIKFWLSGHIGFVCSSVSMERQGVVSGRGSHSQ